MISWHRFYDPVNGRYISADPIGLDGGMNLYAYVDGNPVNQVDPLGLESGYLYGEPGWLGSEWPKIPPPKPPWYNDPNHGLAQSFDPANPKPIRGPFGTLCGAEGTATATWIPDLIPGACKRHDDCYDKCAKNCEGYNCKTKCDYELMSSSFIYGGATYFIGKDAYDDAKQKYGCPCE